MTSYYVAPQSGSDANSGLTELLPIADYAKAGFMSGLVAGDTVYAKSGETYNGQTNTNNVVFASSGTSAAKITLTRYGSNPTKPRITSMRTVSTWTGPNGSGEYTATVSPSAEAGGLYVVVNGDYDNPLPRGVAGKLTSGTFAYSGGTLTLKDKPTGSTVLFSYGSASITIGDGTTGFNNIVIDGVQSGWCVRQGISITDNSLNATCGVVIKNCDTKFCGLNGVIWGFYQGLVIQDCTDYGSFNNGFIADNTSGAGDGLLLLRCRATGIPGIARSSGQASGGGPAYGYANDAIVLHSVTTTFGSLIYACEGSWSNESAIQSDVSDKNSAIRNCLGHDTAQGTISGSNECAINGVVAYNGDQNGVENIHTSGTGCYITGSVVWNCGRVSNNSLNSVSANAKIINNTVIGTATQRLVGLGLNAGTPGNGLFMNNVCVQASTVTWPVIAVTAGAITHWACDYNLYVSGMSTPYWNGGTQRSLANWKSLEFQDAHSLQPNGTSATVPSTWFQNYANSNGDYRPATGSALLNGGFSPMVAISYITETAAFTLDKLLTGATSGAKGTIVTICGPNNAGNSAGTLLLKDVIGQFSTGEVITDNNGVPGSATCQLGTRASPKPVDRFGRKMRPTGLAALAWPVGAYVDQNAPREDTWPLYSVTT